jgi:DNA-binding transcriptional MocR family regulator
MRQISNAAKWTVLAAAALSLAACSTIKSELGAGRVKPDEFAIVPKAPLAMPPDFTNLREPEPGAPRPQQVSPAGEAMAALSQTRGAVKPALSAQQASAGERALADAAGASKADPKVRRAMMEELRDQRGGKSLTERILFWQGPEEGEDMVVDAAAEARRIRQVQKSGDVVTGKGVPVIEKSSEQGLIGRIF